MSSNSKKIVRFDLWIDPVFDQRLRREPGIDLHIGSTTGPAEKGWGLLADAHVFHVSPAKDELPRWLFVNKELLARCPDLLCVSSAGAGYDTTDVAACTEAGVAVMNQAGGNADSVAEFTLGLMIDVSRRISESDRRLRRDRGFSREDVMGHELRGKTVGLVGIGHIGRRVAKLARAFGMNVLATDPYLTPEEIQRRDAQPASLEEVLRLSDIVTLHCPRDKSTLKLIDARTFAAMKRGALFISTARGGIHDEAALADALRSGHIAGAGLDVWHEEPPPLDHPLLGMENVAATFHTAGVSHEGRRNVASIAAEQIVAAMKGGQPPRLVNPEVWPAYAARFERVLGFPVQRHEDTLE
jgi:D-3-phosphoglycerate dehydrogenase / 2-oxoglutarate reductase